MCHCHDFDPIRRDAIDNYERVAFHQVTTRPEHVVCPTLWSILDSTSSVLEFFLKRIRGLLAPLGVPIVRIERVDASIRMEFKWQSSHAYGHAFRASRRPTGRV